MNVTDEKEYYRITPLNSNFRIWKKEIYMCASNYNGLFRANTANGMLNFVTKFENQNYLDMNLFLMGAVENTLIFIPIFANEIALYDLDTCKLFEISLDNIYTKDITNTSNFVVYDDKIWIFPTKGRYIVELDYKNKRVGSVIDIYNIYHSFFNKGYSILGVNGSYAYGDVILLACWEEPYIIEICPKNSTFKFVKVQGCDRGFCALGGEDGNLYALNDDGYIYVREIKSGNIIKKVYIGEEAKRQNNKYYRKIHIYNGKIFLFPFSEITHLKTIDIEAGTIDTKIPQWLQNINTDLFFGYADKDKMYFYTNENHVMCIDTEMQYIDWEMDIQYDVSELKKIMVDDKIKIQSHLIKESKAFSVQDFMQFTTVSNEKESDNTISRGNRIYSTTMYK